MSRSDLKKKSAPVIPRLLLLFMVLLPGGVASQTENQSLPRPDVSLQPEDVVMIILDALANNDHPYPNAGIETTFNFASPANRANTGPLRRFITMVKGPVFGVMVKHKQSELSEVVFSGNRAYLMARLTTADNVAVHFAFRLAQQEEAEFKGMWMTEAVWPLSVAEEVGV